MCVYRETGYRMRLEGKEFSEICNEMGITSEELEVYKNIHNIKWGIMKGNKEGGMSGGYR